MNNENSISENSLGEAPMPPVKKDKLDTYLDGVKALPPTPSLMLRLMTLFKQANPDIDEVARLISRDPSLTSEVLKCCNSPRYRGEKSVSDMFEAIARLGFYEVYRIVMMISATRTISLDNIESVLAVEALCRHSMATAVASGVVAKAVGEDFDAAFIAGLLHDVGKIVLASAEGMRYRSLLQQFKTQGGAIAKAEKQHFGFDHAEIGGRLLDRWGLAPEIFIAVRYHHDVAGAVAASQLTAVVALADMIANGWEKRSATDPVSMENVATAVGVLNLDPEAVTALMTQVHEQLKLEADLLMSSSRGKPAPAAKK
ncbi:MAG TPA: HDOD domain-containing protein [Verrucomicrobiae bacterium]|nr:HDOD domain-containing protein [Verrucomicrobiae bacterium]